MNNKSININREDRYAENSITLKDLFGRDRNNEELLRIIKEGIE